jgi:hypothetical protein
MFILRSWSGQALNLSESWRMSSEVTWPGLPRGTPLASGKLVEVALSGAISSIVDLNRTCDCWLSWSSAVTWVESSFRSSRSWEFVVDILTARGSNEALI